MSSEEFFTYSTWTQFPNQVIDKWLPILKEAELKVFFLIIRFTIGFHRPKHRMSLSFLENKTGLCRKSVFTGIQSLMEKGIIGREADPVHEGQFFYFIKIKETDLSRHDGIEESSTSVKFTPGVGENLHRGVGEILHTVKETVLKETTNKPPYPPKAVEEVVVGFLPGSKEDLKSRLTHMKPEDFEYGWMFYLEKLKKEKIDNPEGLIFSAGSKRWAIAAPSNSEEENRSFKDKVAVVCKKYIDEGMVVVGHDYIDFTWNSDYYSRITDKGFKESVISQLRKMGVDLTSL